MHRVLFVVPGAPSKKTDVEGLAEDVDAAVLYGRNLVFEICDQAYQDEFISRFVHTHLVPIRGVAEAIRVGLVDTRFRPKGTDLLRGESGSGRQLRAGVNARTDNDSDPADYDVSGQSGLTLDDVVLKSSSKTSLRAHRFACTFSDLIVKPKKHNVVTIREIYFRYAVNATLFGVFNIRGLRLQYDTLFWGLLRFPYVQKRENHFSNWGFSVDTLARLVRQAEFRPEATAIARSVARMQLYMHGAATVVYNHYDHHGLASYCRYLCNLLENVYNRLVSSFTSVLDTPAGTGPLYECLPKTVARKAGLSYANRNTEVFLEERFYEQAAIAMESAYRQYCGCAECWDHILEHINYNTLKRNTVAWAEWQKRWRRRHDFVRFEDHRVMLRTYPMLGVLTLPRLRHISVRNQTLLCEQIRENLLIAPDERHFYENALPVPYWEEKPSQHEGVNNILFIITNATMILFLIQTIQRIYRHETENYLKLIEEERVELCRLLLERETELTTQLVRDERFKVLIDHYETYRKWCSRYDFRRPSAANLLAAIKPFEEQLHGLVDVRRLDVHRTVEELLLHHLYIKKMYDDDTPELRAAENRVVSAFVCNEKFTIGLRAAYPDLLETPWCCVMGNTHERSSFALPKAMSRGSLSIRVALRRSVTKFSNTYVRRYRQQEVGNYAYQAIRPLEVMFRAEESDEQPSSENTGDAGEGDYETDSTDMLLDLAEEVVGRNSSEDEEEEDGDSGAGERVDFLRPPPDCSGLNLDTSSEPGDSELYDCGAAVDPDGSESDREPITTPFIDTVLEETERELREST